MSEREAALAALKLWRDRKAWARKDPSGLSVASVEPVGPVQVALTSIYEARGVKYELVAASSRPTHNEDGPQPWNVRLEHPPNPPVGHYVDTKISGTTVHMDCGMCSAQGEMMCATCGGSGRIQHGRSSHTCGRCGGRGQVRCDQCHGSGGLLGYPTVWSRIQDHEIRRVHESDELPNEVFLALSEGDHGGDVFHEQSAEHIVDLVREGGYRDAAGSADPLRQMVQKLCASPEVPEGGRLLRQTLRLSRVKAWEVKLEDGRGLWIYGNPPHVSPSNALPTPAVHAMKIVPGVMVALAVLYGVYWFLAN